MTETLIQRLTRHEGNRLFVYDDATGHALKKGDTIQGNPTIGTGRCLSTKGISEEERVDMLHNDIADAQDALNSALPWTGTLDPIRHDILVEMIFQEGVTHLLGFHNMLAFIQNGDWENAAKEMLNSKWHTQAPERCEELAQLMINGTLN